ncbi:MAG: hypothetical protein JNL24_07695 [Bacteroidia bacterium]|nr:hypothetical protein [Bacteroidia bacterium]
MKLKYNIFINLIGFVVILISCRETKINEEEEINFKKQYFKIEIDTTIFGTVFCNNKFVTLKSNGEFICFNSTDFDTDTIITNKLNKKRCSSFYQMYDSLIVVENNRDYYVNSNFEFIPYNRYKYSYYKSDTTTVYDVYGQKFIDPLYCDSNFVIAQFCFGEFGGTLYFFDLKNDKEYYCPATCASVVNKIGDKYIVTNSLAHEDGSSEVLEITNPETLTELDFDTVKYWGNFWYHSAWNGQSIERYDSIVNVMRGKNKQLLDTTGVLIHTSFKHKEEIYHIYRSEKRHSDKTTNNRNLYIGKIQNNKITAIDSICNVEAFTYNPQNRVYNDWTLYSYNFREKNTGFIAIKDDTINIIEFKIKKKTTK